VPDELDREILHRSPVTGTNGENVLEARAATQAEVWHRAVEQTRSLGMLGRSVFT
jgi:hypothetical protein